MDFREMCDFFGGSVFIEEPRGSFVDASTRIQDREANRTDPSKDEMATLLLLKAVHAALVGNIRNEDGMPSFNTHIQALYNGGFGNRWLFRTRSYVLLLSTWQFYPPLFRFCNLQRGPSSMLIETTLNPHAHHSRLVEQCLEAIDDVEPMDKLEFSIIREVWTLSHRALEAARVSNPGYKFHSPHLQHPLHNPEIFENCCHRLMYVRDLAEELCFNTISTYAERLILEVRQAQGVPQASEDLERLQARYEEFEDHAGVGICRILCADAMVSSPFTSPLAFDLLPVDGWDTLGSDTICEKLEWKPVTLKDVSKDEDIASEFESIQLSRDTHDEKWYAHEDSEPGSRPAAGYAMSGTCPALDTTLASQDSQDVFVGAGGSPRGSDVSLDPIRRTDDSWSTAVRRAMRCYQEADGIFSRIGAMRGRALVASRKACLLLTQEISPLKYWEKKDRTILENIKEHFDTACELFRASGDVIHFKLTQMHLVLLASEAMDDVFELQHKIGEWGSQSENWVFARQLGLLAFRFGDHLRYGCGSIARARLAYECARHVLIKIPEQWTASFQLEYAMTTLHLSTSDLSAGKLALHVADTIFARLASELSEAAERDPAWNHAKQFFAMMLADLKISAAQKWENSESMRRTCYEQLQLVESYELSPDKLSLEIREWLTEKRKLVDAYALITEYEEDIDKGDWEAGRDKLANHVAQMPRPEDADLEMNLARVDILLKLQEFEAAHDVLQVIAGNETLNEISIGLAFQFGNHSSLYQRRPSIRALESVLQRCINSRFWTRSFYFQSLIEAQCPDYFLFPGNYSLALPWQRALWLGLIEEAQEKYELAYHSFFQSWAIFHSEWLSVNSFDLRNALVNHGDFDRIAASLARLHLRMETIDKESRRIPARFIPDETVRLVRQWNRSLDLRDWDLRAEALGALERGKALSMAQSLSFNAEANVDNIKEWDRVRHRFRLWLDLQFLKRPRTEAEENEYQELNDASLEEDLKTYPLHTVDMRPLSEQVLEWPTVLMGVPKDALVVYISLSEDGLALFGIDESNILVATWQEVSAASTRQMVSRYIGLLATYKDEAPEDVLDIFIWSMSEVFIKPLEHMIRAKSQIIFVPSGDLARFPLGVLLFDERPLGLQMPVSQVPSLSALAHISRRSVAGNAVLSAIARPGSVREEHAKGPPALPMAGIEALLIGQTFDFTPLNASEVSKDRFREEMERCSIIHLSTHGHFDASAPLLSHILLREKFRVIDLLNVRTKASLVVLSACLSGTGKTNHGDDVVGFSHAVLAAGAHAFLGALWAANDLITMIQMMFFYMGVVIAKEPVTLARLWHEASTMLFFAEPHQIKALLDTYIKRWDALEEDGLQPGAFVKNGRRKLEEAAENWILENGEPALNLKHPYFWANFVMVGNANISMRKAEAPFPRKSSGEQVEKTTMSQEEEESRNDLL